MRIRSKTPKGLRMDLVYFGARFAVNVVMFAWALQLVWFGWEVLNYFRRAIPRTTEFAFMSMIGSIAVLAST